MTTVFSLPAWSDSPSTGTRFATVYMLIVSKIAVFVRRPRRRDRILLYAQSTRYGDLSLQFLHWFQLLFLLVVPIIHAIWAGETITDPSMAQFHI